MTDLYTVIERLNDAEFGSRELDALIGLAIDFHGPDLPHWSTSIDAALTLVPEGWFLVHLGDDAVGIPAGMKPLGNSAELSDGDIFSVANGLSRAITICIAALNTRTAT